MITKLFYDYSEFKEIFGTQKERKNKIFLSAYKHFCKNKKRKEFERLAGGRTTIFSLVGGARVLIESQDDHEHRISLGDMTFWSNQYKLDDLSGICEDGDAKSVRYVRVDNDRVFKMKASKFFSTLLRERGFDKMFGEALTNYLIEVFTKEFYAYADANIVSELKVDNDFEFIYSSCNYVSDSFGSCMTDEGFEGFYNSCVNASAASILNKEGYILARCVVFHDVQTSDGEIVDIADRQYAQDGKEHYKTMLVDALIDKGMIQAFKSYNAQAGHAHAFEGVDGSDWSSKRLSIDCSIDEDDYVPYMDTFKYYDHEQQTASNRYTGCSAIELTTTDGSIELGDWDEYNEEYTTDNLIRIYRWLSWRHMYEGVMCSEPYAENNMYWVEYLNAYADEASYSDLVNEYLPIDEFEEIELEWKAENWDYDEYNDEYVECTIECHIWDGLEYKVEQVCEDYASRFFVEYDGEYYDEVSSEGIPYLLEELTV